MSALFIAPIDVLFLRGNKLFGDAGSFGESLVPPWPSVAAGAIRTAILNSKHVNFAQFANNEVKDIELGSPSHPGSFYVKTFQLASWTGSAKPTPIYPLPADLVVHSSTGKKSMGYVKPSPTGVGLLSSCVTPLLPVLSEAERCKPSPGFWLLESGWRKYLQAEKLELSDLIASADLWALDSRVGIGLSTETKSAEDGKLFTVQAVALKPGVGFIVESAGANLEGLSTLRLGGDGRAATCQIIQIDWPEADYKIMATAGRCKIVLTTPGIFELGWLPAGFTKQPDGHFQFDLMGVRARLVSASVPRYDVISGWDLANKSPKPSVRVVPSGAVYWLDDLQATPEALGKLADHGLWKHLGHNTSRRAEGFNRFSFAAW